MPAPRPYAWIGTEDQWHRCAFDDGAALVDGVVQLAWEEPPPKQGAFPDSPLAAGAAFDSVCRLYLSFPVEGRIERRLWAAEPEDAGAPLPVDLFAQSDAPPAGDFIPATPSPPALATPLGLAIDREDRLYVAEAGACRVLIFDLSSNRLLRKIPLPARPLDVALCGKRVLAAVEGQSYLASLSLRGEPRWVKLPEEVQNVCRLAVAPDGEVYLLESSRSENARIVPFHTPSKPKDVPYATDLEFLRGSSMNKAALVVAQRPEEEFLRLRFEGKNWTEPQRLMARGYDGSGIVRTPDGRIGFTSSLGFRYAVPARVRYFRTARVVGFALDSGDFHTVWGRLFLDACIPRNNRVGIHFIASDELPERDVWPRKGKPIDDVQRPDLSPSMPNSALVPSMDIAGHELYRRDTGCEQPWTRFAKNDPFETYEAPIQAGPGRYLWVILKLEGNGLSTPRIRALRAEYPGHDYLKRLPKLFSRDERAASFLGRYLAMFEGFLGELEGKADARHTLLDPRSTPPEFLPWLASFLGLALDERFAHAPRPGGRTEDVRRVLISEAVWLFRFRGTVGGLSRFLEIYVGSPVVIIEKFRLRSLGGSILHQQEGVFSGPVLGAGLRVGGALGEAQTVVVGGGVEQMFDEFAHRFSVIIRSSLDDEALSVVQNILDLHRPSHTDYEICTVDSGMRVGIGLHVELNSIIGRSGGFASLRVNDSLLGRYAILGRPADAGSVGNSRLDLDARIG